MTDDYIKREDAINKLAKIITGDIFKEIKEDTKKSVAKDFFSDIQAADVVEVVRCEDCIHNHTKTWNQGKRDKPSCRFTDLIRSNKFYCGFGERAEE